ncbi:FMN-dependent NADH-azoreductase [Bacillus kwashiorkori]|uniref:FMN-dependent NADH-azoreductase n=1 Tax=Bacillus kwashiorkori TaxID=1522318 RepID=UPI00078527E0|nr:FMN-dependent NADH-azoreductase [Bacillus kwashiorkori]
MANILIVKAHPFSEDVSRSMKVTNAFIESYKEHHPEDKVEELNLYDISLPEIDRDLLNAWSSLQSGQPFYALTPAQQHKVTLFDSFTDSFLASEKVVIANPLWNLSVPTRLKAWLDTITVAGKTFKYTDHGSIGLLTGKKVLHIQANGGMYSGKDPASQYVKTLFNFLGVEDFHQLFVEGMDHQPERAAEIVSEAIQQAMEMAKSF